MPASLASVSGKVDFSTTYRRLVSRDLKVWLVSVDWMIRKRSRHRTIESLRWRMVMSCMKLLSWCSWRKVSDGISTVD